VTVTCQVDNPEVPCCGFYVKEPPSQTDEQDPEAPDEDVPAEEDHPEGPDVVEQLADEEEGTELPGQDFECSPEIVRLAKLSNVLLLAQACESH